MRASQRSLVLVPVESGFICYCYSLFVSPSAVPYGSRSVKKCDSAKAIKSGLHGIATKLIQEVDKIITACFTMA